MWFKKLIGAGSSDPARPEAGSSGPARLEAGSSDPAQQARPKGPASIAIALAACPICFQVEDARTAEGVRAAVIVLGGVTAIVLGAVAVFAHRLMKHE